MGRGATSPQEILYGQHASTRQPEAVITLTGNQEAGLRALALLKTERPNAPGFTSSTIGDAASRLPSRDPFAGVNGSTAGNVVSSLVKKGLVEKVASGLNSVGQITEEENGWRLTQKGFEEAKLLGLDTPLFPPRHY